MLTSDSQHYKHHRHIQGRWQGGHQEKTSSSRVAELERGGQAAQVEQHRQKCRSQQESDDDPVSQLGAHTVVPLLSTRVVFYGVPWQAKTPYQLSGG